MMHGQRRHGADQIPESDSAIEPKAPPNRPWVGDSQQIEPPHQSELDLYRFGHAHTLALISADPQPQDERE
jgi:hypothetical protein